MSDIITGTLEPASEYNQRTQAALANELPFILASEVVSEFQKRCANGMQYTTFPNRISDLEKGKLETAGYIVTRNTIDSSNRDGAPNLYIGFQVALNLVAAEKAMVISQKETNGIEPGTSDYNELENKPTINNVVLQGNRTLSDLGIDELTQEQVNTLEGLLS